LDSAGQTIFLGEWNCPASAFFPPAGGGWGGMRAGFGTDLFSKSPPFQFRFAKYVAEDLIPFNAERFVDELFNEGEM